MKVKVHVARFDECSAREFQQINDLFAKQSGPIEFFFLDESLGEEPDVWEWESLFQTIVASKLKVKIPPGEFFVALTGSPNRENWFSAWQKEGKIIFIAAHGWENYIFADPCYPTAYEIIANILQCMTYNSLVELAEEHAHEEPIGCMNDMCGWKPHISFKLRTADICPECWELMRMREVGDEVLEQAISIFEDLRSNMLYSERQGKTTHLAEQLPFPVAITKKKLGTTSDPLRKFLYLIDHFDSLIRTAVIFLARLTFKDLSEINKFMNSSNLNSRPSLGHWLNGLQKILNHHGGVAYEVELPDNVHAKMAEIAKLAEESKIIALRNEYRGHGYINCHDQAYQQLFEAHVQEIQLIEEILFPLFQEVRLVVISGTGRIAASNYRYSFKELSGSDAIFQENNIEISTLDSNDIPIDNHVYLTAGDYSQWYDLHPLILYVNCPLCSHIRVLVADGELYLDPFVGHRVDIELSSTG